MAQICVLANPAARRGRSDVDAVIEGIRSRGVDPVLLVPASAAEARRLARDALAEEPERVVVVGGDGLVRIVVDALAGGPGVLGIVPQGTGNDFARALGLTSGRLGAHIERALAEPVAVDAVRTDRGWVASVLTGGFSAAVNERAATLRWPGGQARYGVATVRELPRLAPMAVRLGLDDRVIETETVLLAAGNTAYFGGGMRICPGARPDDGTLEVVTVDAVRRSTFLRVFPLVFVGRHVAHPSVHRHRVRELTIEMADASTPPEFWADGDPLGPPPIRAEVVPGALAVAGARWGRR